jgi:hypothetical protein
MLTVTEIDLEQQDIDFRILRSRCEQLRRAGYGLRAALLLAIDPDIDVEHAAELVQRGCPADTALRILI